MIRNKITHAFKMLGLVQSIVDPLLASWLCDHFVILNNMKILSKNNFWGWSIMSRVTKLILVKIISKRFLILHIITLNKDISMPTHEYDFPRYPFLSNIL